jgi:uncharacterized membrane protein
MKLFSLSILLVVIAADVVSAQQATALPTKEFTLALSQNVLEIKPGEKKDVMITLLRSRSYSKLKAEINLSSSLPPGVDITFEASNGIIESTKALITVSDEAKPGNYTIIVNGSINHKNKGAMLKLVIGSANELVSGR